MRGIRFVRDVGLLVLFVALRALAGLTRGVLGLFLLGSHK